VNRIISTSNSGRIYCRIFLAETILSLCEYSINTYQDFNFEQWERQIKNLVKLKNVLFREDSSTIVLPALLLSDTEVIYEESHFLNKKFPQLLICLNKEFDEVLSLFRFHQAMSFFPITQREMEVRIFRNREGSANDLGKYFDAYQAFVVDGDHFQNHQVLKKILISFLQKDTGNKASCTDEFKIRPSEDLIDAIECRVEYLSLEMLKEKLELMLKDWCTRILPKPTFVELQYCSSKIQVMDTSKVYHNNGNCCDENQNGVSVRSTIIPTNFDCSKKQKNKFLERGRRKKMKNNLSIPISKTSSLENAVSNLVYSRDKLRRQFDDPLKECNSVSLAISPNPDKSSLLCSDISIHERELIDSNNTYHTANNVSREKERISTINSNKVLETNNDDAHTVSNFTPIQENDSQDLLDSTFEFKEKHRIIDKKEIIVPPYDRDLTPPLYKKKSSAKSLNFEDSVDELECMCQDLLGSAKHQKIKKKFTELEKSAIIEGVEKFGVGKWRKIKDEYPDVLTSRSNINIKDCYRNMTSSGKY